MSGLMMMVWLGEFWGSGIRIYQSLAPGSFHGVPLRFQGSRISGWMPEAGLAGRVGQQLLDRRPDGDHAHRIGIHLPKHRPQACMKFFVFIVL